MPIITPQGLKGLQGIGSLSKADYDAFVRSNDALISRHAYDPTYISNLYNNKQFIDRYGVDQFKAIPDFDTRNNLLREDVVNEEWNNLYGDMDDQWKQKYGMMSTDAKQKVLESSWLTPKEFEDDWNSKKEKSLKLESGWDAALSGLAPMGSAPESRTEDYYGEMQLQFAKDNNDKTLEKIYNDDVDSFAKTLGDEVAAAHISSDITKLSDEQVDSQFKKAVVPNSYVDQSGRPNAGIPEFAKFYVENPENGGDEMKNFSIDDKRKVLAMKQVYEKNMSPEMAATALNNYAMRYNKEQQSTWDKLGKFGNDVLIAATSYSFDKINSLYNVGLAAADQLSEMGYMDKPKVWVDEQGNIVDAKSVGTETGSTTGYYTDENMKEQPVHLMEVDRTTLHNMGKNEDGTEDESLLNPQDWTAREAMGVWNKNLAKEYQKLGTSPYKVVYEPNDDSDLMYESFKMMSFGLADGAAQVIPFGIGRVGQFLSAANKIGRVGRAFGTVLNKTGRLLTAQTKTGQIAQGLAGAGGIAYAYQRGSFNETLQQNLANAEEAALNKSKKEVYDQYQNNSDYKAQVDSLIAAEATKMKAEYISQLGEDGQKKIADKKILDKVIQSEAQKAVLGNIVQNKYNEYKGSDEYAALQNEAINSAGDAAWRTFLPEAIKYGLVNTIGYRKWLYSNPTGLKNKIGAGLEGLREVTTTAGKQRLATDGSKFLTRADKWKKLGKVAASQIWGGAWTNGTDDMMVDAAERINADSFDKYLQSFENGQSMANTYGFADGLYSYWKGLNNSMGQETTWNAATVGGLGSLLSFTPNMTNIVHYFTKEGKQQYKDNFTRRPQRNEDGTIKKDEKGNTLYEEISAKDNWRDRFNYFIQNGVLNTYYGAKQNERDLEAHADYVNNLLDDYDDFKVIEELITSDIALDNAESAGDQKTMRFVKAINAMNALNQLAQNPNDPTTLSSVVQNAKDFISKATQLTNNADRKGFSQEEIDEVLAQWYANNPSMVQSDYNNWLALHNVGKNARKLQEASEAYDKAEEQVSKIEKNLGKRIDPAVRAKMKMNQALDGHWRERVKSMQHEIDDVSDITGEVSLDNLIPSIGSRKNAEALVKVYEKQQAELQKEMEEQRKKTQELEEALDVAKTNRDNAKSSEEQYSSQLALDEAQAKYDDALQQEAYLRDLGERTTDKRTKLTEALLHQVQDTDGKYQEKILTADEIFALDPVTRARMLNTDNRSLYNDAQKREISKLEQRLIMKDGDALNKIQDIARLSQRVAANEDAYSRMARNPDAAAVALESQRAQDADAAYKLINYRNATTVADFINQFDEAMVGHNDVTQEQRNQFAFRSLRKMSPTLLDIIDEDTMLPQYQQQVLDAKEWGKVVADINAVVKESEESQDWKDNISKNIEQVVETANNRDEIMSNLEKVIDDVKNPQVAQDFEKVLNALEQLGYQRDATVIESRKQRKEREEAEAQRKKEAEEDAKIAAAEAQAKAQEVANSQQAHEVKADGSNLQSPWDVAPIDQSEENAVQQGELSNETLSFDTEGNPVIENNAESSLEWQVNPEVKITKDIANREFNAAYTISATDERVNEYEQPKLKATADYLNGKINDREYLKAYGYETGKDSWLDSPSTSKEDIANEAKKKAEVRKKYLKNNKETATSVNSNVEGHNIVDNGESVQGKSSNIDEQMSEANEGKEAHSSEENTDFAAQNGTGEHVSETSAVSLSGNVMAEWKPVPLKTDGKLVHKQGENTNDSMSRYYAWMNAAGIKLQNIIDQELGQILIQNPHAKVKFMVIRPENNATKDGDMKTHLMLVLDYDNHINKGITNIHKDENGGVLESNGKQYLVIGTVGYGNRNADKLALYDILFSNNPRSSNGYGLVKRGQGEYFRTHPSDRFYVHPTLETEIVPMSLIPGYIVKELESDSNSEFRSIREIIAEPARNPNGVERINDLAFGIQELSKFLVVGTTLDKVMVPRNTERNSGSAFVLLPASNGKLVPSYLKPLFYNEMNEGQLKDRVVELFSNVVSPNYSTRLQAVEDLSKIFYFNKDGDTILLMKSKNVLSLVHDGKPFKTFTLDENFDRQAFMEAVAEMNPRVNITKSVLQSNVLLQQYDEVGALQTDAALLNTAGASYSIYGLDAQGNMLQPETVNNDIPKSSRNSSFRNGDKSQVVFKRQYYNYDVNEGKYYLNSIPVTDETLIKSLDYNRRILEAGISPVESQGVWNTYILGSKEHPEAVRIHRNTKEVKELSDAEALQLIEKIEKENAEKARAEAAKQTLEAKKTEDVDLGIDEEGMVVDEETGELITPQELQQRQAERTATFEEKEKKEGEEESAEPSNNQTDKLHRSGAQLESNGQQGATQNFNTLAKSRQWRKLVSETIKQKWPDAPRNMTELENFLKAKNVEVDAIGTSDTAVKAWLKTIIDCR